MAQVAWKSVSGSVGIHKRVGTCRAALYTVTFRLVETGKECIILIRIVELCIPYPNAFPPDARANVFGKKLRFQVAQMVTFLASDDSVMVTGATHTVDGGWSLKA